MDPSYNNNFGSSMDSASTAPMGSGGVALAPQKKSKKWLILVIILALLVVGGLGYFAYSQISKNNEQAKLNSAKTVYNYYVNYVMFGAESNGDIDEIALLAATPYFYNLEQRTSYAKTVENKYTNFKNNYSGTQDVRILKSFFQDYATFDIMDSAEIAKLYSENGGNGENVLQAIEEHYKTDDETEEYWKRYLTAEKALAEALLAQVKNAGAAGCVQNGIMVEGCYAATEAENVIIGEKAIATMSAASSLENVATNTLIDIYDEIYNSDEVEE